MLELVFTGEEDLLIADSAGGVHRWDIRSEKPSWSIDAHEGAITGLVVSTDQSLFATSSEDRTAAVWRVAGGGRVTSLTGHTDPVRTIAFSPNDRTVLTGSCRHGTVRAWDRLTGNEQATLAKEQCVIRQIAFSRSGNACFYGCEDGTVRRIEPEQQ